MTPRERAEAMFAKLADPTLRCDREFVAVIEAAITEHARALLADDEATVELMADRLGDWLQPRLRALDAARAVLAALRRKELGE